MLTPSTLRSLSIEYKVVVGPDPVGPLINTNQYGLAPILRKVCISSKEKLEVERL